MCLEVVFACLICVPNWELPYLKCTPKMTTPKPGDGSPQALGGTASWYVLPRSQHRTGAPFTLQIYMVSGIVPGLGTTSIWPSCFQ